MSKIAIVGAGFVGSTAAYSLLIHGIAEEIVLIDIHREKAHGEAMDLEHGMQFVPNCDITYSNKYTACKDADVIVVCAGAHQKPGETRLDLVQKNASIFKGMIPNITRYNKKGVFLIVSNPVDVLTYLTIKYSKISLSVRQAF
jgi:L-lactate dehydrogenase